MITKHAQMSFLSEAEKRVPVSEKKVDLSRNLFASGLRENRKVFAEEGEVVEDGVDLGAVDGRARGQQVADDALTNVITGNKLRKN